MGHKQPLTPLQIDKAMAYEVFNVNIKPKTNKINGHAIPLA